MILKIIETILVFGGAIVGGVVAYKETEDLESTLCFAALGAFIGTLSASALGVIWM